MHEALWFYTSPVEEVAARRGDPLGLQSVAETVAEKLVPGLSNRTVDARWLSILCWCMREGHRAWLAYGKGQDLSGQASIGKHLYPWIRPLELLWVAHAVESTVESGRGRQLPGIRPVSKWIEQGRRAEDFGFSAASYEQYRFTGAYGGYRAALRSLGQMSAGGMGWLPGVNGEKLAEIIAKHAESPPAYTPRRGPSPTPENHWQASVNWGPSSTEFLPTTLRQPAALDGDERLILRKAIFESQETAALRQQSSRRLRVARAAASSKATTRAELMADIATKLKGESDLSWLPFMGAFTALADAGTAAMNACWRAVSEADDTLSTCEGVSRNPDVKDALSSLVEASRHWSSLSSRSFAPRANQLAQALLLKPNDLGITLANLINFHTQYGGGLRWVMLDGTTIRPVARLRSGDGSIYQYRLPALARLAKQCGATNSINPLLLEQAEAEE